MDVRYSAEADAYREKVQAFLAEHLPADWKGTGGLEGEALERFSEEWRRTLYENGYLAVSWPREYGGAGGAPLRAGVVGREVGQGRGPTGGPPHAVGIPMGWHTV